MDPGWIIWRLLSGIGGVGDFYRARVLDIFCNFKCVQIYRCTILTESPLIQESDLQNPLASEFTNLYFSS